MTAVDSVGRAAAARKMDIRYKLGRGGTDPTALTPADGKGRLDCSGLTSWCHGLDRVQWVDGEKRYLSTAGIRADALSAQPRWYRQVDRPALGDLVVYARHLVKLKPRLFGHVAIVTGVSRLIEWDPAYPGCWALLDVTHCAGSHKWPRAVRQTPATQWGKLWGKPHGTLIVRRVG